MQDTINEIFEQIYDDFLQEYRSFYRQGHFGDMNASQIQIMRILVIGADDKLKTTIVFIYSCMKNDIDMVRQISRSYSDLNITEYNNLALKLACFYNCHQIVYFLYETYPNLIIDSESFASACHSGNLILAEFLLQHGTIDLQHDYIIHWTCRAGHLHIMKFLCQQFEIQNTKLRDICHNLNIGVQVAATNPDLKLLNFILEKFPHTQNELHRIIYCLCENDNLDAIIYLMAKYSIDKLYEDEAFYSSCRSHQLIAAKWLLQNYSQLYDSDKSTALITACQTNNVNAIAWLKSLWPDINYRVKKYNYIREKFLDGFMIACKNDCVDVLQYLSDNYRLGRTNMNLAAIKACRHNSIGAFKYLTRTFGKLQSIDKCFIIACSNGNLELAKFIASENPQLNYYYMNHEAFRSVYKNGYIDILYWLIELYPSSYIPIMINYLYMALSQIPNTTRHNYRMRVMTHINAYHDLSDISTDMAQIKTDIDALTGIKLKSAKKI